MSKFLKRGDSRSQIDIYPSNEPEFTSFTVCKAVQEGIKINPHLAAGLRIIAAEENTVPWKVIDKNKASGEAIKEHHIGKVLNKPSDEFPGAVHHELLTQWMIVAGDAYEYRNKVGGKTIQLNPITPDRLGLKYNKKGALIGYELYDQNYKTIKTFGLDEIVRHARQVDPSNPYRGISTLETAARMVDIDSEQQRFQYHSLFNRGAVDLLLIAKKAAPGGLGDMVAKFKEYMGGSENARGISAVTGDVEVKKLGLSPLEIDYLKTRIQNKTDIYGVLHIPVEFTNVGGSSFSNLKEAKQTLYTLGVIPILDRKKSAYNHFFADELKPNEEITYDLSNVLALQEDQESKVKRAVQLWDMGQPATSINKELEMNMDTSWEGADKPWGGKEQPTGRKPAAIPTKFDRKDNKNGMSSEEIPQTLTVNFDDIDKIVEKIGTPFFQKQFLRLQNKVSGAEDMLAAAESDKETFKSETATFLSEIFFQYAGQELAEQDGISDDILIAGVALGANHIFSATERFLTEQINFARDAGLSRSELNTMVDDLFLGWTSPTGRSFVIASTEIAAAANMGAYAKAKALKKKFKIWNTANDLLVRPEHTGMDGEKQKLNEIYSNGARFPLDPNLPANQRVNCRCFETYS